MIIVSLSDIPSSSALDRRAIETAYYKDSYRTPLSRANADSVEIFLAIFGHKPLWMKLIFIIRNWLVKLVGIKASPASEIMNPAFKDNYRVGEKIGVWRIYSVTDTEIIAGEDNKHQDFRVSVLRVVDGTKASVVVSTLCLVHNAFGKMYLFVILPFHKWGLQWLIARAVKTGRL